MANQPLAVRRLQEVLEGIEAQHVSFPLIEESDQPQNIKGSRFYSIDGMNAINRVEVCTYFDERINKRRSISNFSSYEINIYKGWKTLMKNKHLLKVPKNTVLKNVDTGVEIHL
jgi:hypothetical protein